MTKATGTAGQDERSTPYPLGVSLRASGLNVAVYSETAEAVDVAVFDDGGA